MAVEGSCLGNSPLTAAAGAVVLCSAADPLAGLAGALSSLLLTRYSSKLSGTRPVEYSNLLVLPMWLDRSRPDGARRMREETRCGKELVKAAAIPPPKE